MSTQSNALPDSSFDGGEVAPAPVSATRPIYWSVRRELWENRSVYVAPFVAAAVVLFGFSISLFTLPRRVNALTSVDAAQQRATLATPYSIAGSLIIMTTLVVAAFYCLDALYGERRDRSILFWKSLPVSDFTTVVSKAMIPLVVLPVLGFLTIVVTQLAMLVLSTMVLLVSPAGVATLWRQLPLFEMTLVLLYGLVVHAFWYAPLYGWLLLISAWARRTPFLWAVLPPLGLVVVERIAFQTSHVASLLRYRAIGAMTEAFALTPGDDSPIIPLTQLDPRGFLSSPGLWIGLAAAAAFLAAAARLRRHRGPI